MLKHPDFPGTATAEAPEEELEDQGASGGGGVSRMLSYVDGLQSIFFHLAALLSQKEEVKSPDQILSTQYFEFLL